MSTELPADVIPPQTSPMTTTNLPQALAINSIPTTSTMSDEVPLNTTPAMDVTEDGQEHPVTTEVGLFEGNNDDESDLSSLSNLSDSSSELSSDSDSDCQSVSLNNYTQMSAFISRMVSDINDDFDETAQHNYTNHNDDDQDIHIPKVTNLSIDYNDPRLQAFIEENNKQNLNINKRPLYPGLQPLGQILNYFEKQIILQPYGLKNPLFTSSDDDSDDDTAPPMGTISQNNKDFFDKSYTPKVPTPDELSELTTLNLNTPVYNFEGLGVGRLSDIMGSVLFPHFVVAFANEPLPEQETSIAINNNNDEEDDTAIKVVENNPKQNTSQKRKGGKKGEALSQIKYTLLPKPDLKVGDMMYILPSTSTSVPTKSLMTTKPRDDNDGSDLSTTSSESELDDEFNNQNTRTNNRRDYKNKKNYNTNNMQQIPSGRDNFNTYRNNNNNFTGTYNTNMTQNNTPVFDSNPVRHQDKKQKHQHGVPYRHTPIDWTSKPSQQPALPTSAYIPPPPTPVPTATPFQNQAAPIENPTSTHEMQQMVLYYQQQLQQQQQLIQQMQAAQINQTTTGTAQVQQPPLPGLHTHPPVSPYSTGGAPALYNRGPISPYGQHQQQQQQQSSGAFIPPPPPPPM